MQALKSVLAALLLTFSLVACSDNGVNRNIVEAKLGVVVIMSTKTNPIKGESSSLGTGFFIGENEILTNYHVIGDATSIVVAGRERAEPMDAEVVYGDPVSDLAVIRLKDWEKYLKTYTYKVLPLAKSDDFEVTQDMYVIGHPWGLYYSVSRGILSHPYRMPKPIPQYLLQTDAHLFNGNSGGPMLNDDGEVIAVSSNMVMNEGGSYGFGIPVRLVKKVLYDLKMYGEARWATLGIQIDDATIKSLVPDGAAAKSGMLVGDLVVEIENSEGVHKIESGTDVLLAVFMDDYVVPLRVKVMRSGKPVELIITPSYRTQADFADNLSH